MATRRTGDRSGARVFTGGAQSGLIDDIFDVGIEFARRRAGLPPRDGGGGGSFPPPEGGFAETCPTGFEFVNGECLKKGLRGKVERMVPGGETGRLPTSGFGNAVLGAFDIPALEPRQTGTVITRSGEVRVTLGCPRGAVLGKDNLCYQKGTISPKFRKWRPAARAPVTAGDAKAIRRADSAKDRVEKLAKSTGLFVSRSRPKQRRLAAGKKC